MKTTLWTCVLGLALLGCADDGSPTEVDGDVNGDGSDTGVPDGAWLPLEGASPDLNRYLEAVCRIAERCGNESMSQCRVGYEGYYCDPAFRELELPNLDGCLAAREASGCETKLLPECFAIRQAMVEARGERTLVARGEACDDYTLTCDYDLYCTASAGQCGQCAPLRKEGDACQDYDECGNGLYCSGQNVCTKFLPAGSVCNEDVDACDFGLRCIDSKCTTYKQGDYGAACSSDDQCYAGFCLDGSCGGAVACGEAELGAPCWNDAACGDGLLCDAYARRCVAQIADGEPCDYDDPYLCAPSSHCTYADDTGTSTVCMPKSANGAECFSPGQTVSECASGWCNAQGGCDEPVPVCQ